MRIRDSVRALILAAVVARGATAQASFPDLGYFKFDEGAGGIVTNVATPGMGPASYTFAAVPQASWWVTPGAIGPSGLNFYVTTAGTNEVLATQIVPDYAGSFTIEGWFRPEVVNPTGYILGDTSAGTHRLYTFTTTISWRGANGLSPYPEGPYGAVQGQWYHVALVQDATALTRTLYVDGAIVSMQSHTPVAYTAAVGLSFGDYLPGISEEYALDEMRVWSYARSAGQILADYQVELFDNNVLVVQQSGAGIGDLNLSLTMIAPGVSEGWTLISANTALPVGTGPFFGINPDAITWSILFEPALLGSPLHFPITGIAGIWPDSPIVAPPGTLNFLAGLEWDFVVALFDGGLNYAGKSNTVRLLFQ